MALPLDPSVLEYLQRKATGATGAHGGHGSGGGAGSNVKAYVKNGMHGGASSTIAPEVRALLIQKYGDALDPELAAAQRSDRFGEIAHSTGQQFHNAASLLTGSQRTDLGAFERKRVRDLVEQRASGAARADAERNAERFDREKTTWAHQDDEHEYKVSRRPVQERADELGLAKARQGLEAGEQDLEGKRAKLADDARQRTTITDPESPPSRYARAMIERRHGRGSVPPSATYEQLAPLLTHEEKAAALESQAQDRAAMRSHQAAVLAETTRHNQATEGSGGAGKPPPGFRYTANGDLEAIPGGPADLKTQATNQRIAEGSSDVEVALATLRDAYDRLERGGGITSTNKGALSNMGAAISASDVGQRIGKTLGTDNQSARNDITMARPALLGALMKATGMSAKQMDSNAELKLWLATATDPTLDIEANRRALANIERKYLAPARSGAPAPAAGAAAPVKVQTIEEARALPKGTRFVTPDGREKVR